MRVCGAIGTQQGEIHLEIVAGLDILKAMAAAMIPVRLSVATFY